MLRLITAILGIQQAFADIVGGSPPAAGIPGLPTPTKDLGTILKDIGSFAVGLGLILASLMIVFAGYQILTARGDAEQFRAGTNTITYAVIGVIVLLLSATVITILKELLGY